MTDMILFGVFPYVAVALMIGVGIYRYRVDRYSWSSQSSQFLESRLLFWGRSRGTMPSLLFCWRTFSPSSSRQAGRFCSVDRSVSTCSKSPVWRSGSAP